MDSAVYCRLVGQTNDRSWKRFERRREPGFREESGVVSGDLLLKEQQLESTCQLLERQNVEMNC